MSVWKRTNKSDRKKRNSLFLRFDTNQQLFFNMSQKFSECYDKIILDYMIKKPAVDYIRRKKHKVR